ncbi:hypothetical protein ACPB8Q_02845 [Methanocaldococcus indicus]|uniref:hypothetical protein n=1 Tax=Methanocaldococcus indicus TaxID=213231 RepID=UPI003C6CE849
MKKFFICFLIIFLLICGCIDNNSKDIDKNNKNNVNNSSLNESIITKNLNKSILNTTSKTTNITEIKRNVKKINLENINLNVSIDRLFLNLNYSNTIIGNNIIVKKYKNISFVVSMYPINLRDAYKFNNVKEYPQQDIYGKYYYYEFYSLSNSQVSYCYYRKVGNYYIILQGYNKKELSKFWDDWINYLANLKK